eukprot:scaffold4543_cov45-Prasinocladus_malaysianus.AAC.1
MPYPSNRTRDDVNHRCDVCWLYVSTTEFNAFVRNSPAASSTLAIAYVLVRAVAASNPEPRPQTMCDFDSLLMLKLGHLRCHLWPPASLGREK